MPRIYEIVDILQMTSSGGNRVTVVVVVVVVLPDDVGGSGWILWYDMVHFSFGYVMIPKTYGTVDSRYIIYTFDLLFVCATTATTTTTTTTTTTPFESRTTPKTPPNQTSKYLVPLRASRAMMQCECGVLPPYAALWEENQKRRNCFLVYSVYIKLTCTFYFVSFRLFDSWYVFLLSSFISYSG